MTPTQLINLAHAVSADHPGARVLSVVMRLNTREETPSIAFVTLACTTGSTWSGDITLAYALIPQGKCHQWRDLGAELCDVLMVTP